MVRSSFSALSRAALYSLVGLSCSLIGSDSAAAQPIQYIQSLCHRPGGAGTNCEQGTGSGSAVASGYLASVGQGMDFFAVGEHIANGGAGRVSQYGPYLWGSERWVTTGLQGDYLGHSLAAGDINRDLNFEVLAGAPQRQGSNVYGPGYVKLIDGDTGAVILTRQGQASGDSYGVSVAFADLNGSGAKKYLLVGAPDAQNGQGAPSEYVEIIELDTAVSPPTIAASSILTVPAQLAGQDADFGASVAAVDLDGNGIDEIIVGAPNARNAAISAQRIGTVVVYQDGQTNSPDLLWGQYSSTKRNRLFGYSLAGMPDSDGQNATQAEIIIGDPDYLDTSRGQIGQVTVAEWTAGNSFRVISRIEGSNYLSKFGTAVTGSSYDPGSNSLSDIVIGSPGIAGTNGQVDVLSWDSASSGFIGQLARTGTPGGNLGSSVSGFLDPFTSSPMLAPAFAAGEPQAGLGTFSGMANTFSADGGFVDTSNIAYFGNACNSASLNTPTIAMEGGYNPGNTFRVAMSINDAAFTAAAGNHPAAFIWLWASNPACSQQPGIPMNLGGNFGCELCQPAHAIVWGPFSLTAGTLPNEWVAKSPDITIPQNQAWAGSIIRFQGILVADLQQGTIGSSGLPNYAITQGGDIAFR